MTAPVWIAIASGLLIVAGIVMVLRDVRRRGGAPDVRRLDRTSRPSAAGPAAVSEAAPSADADVTIVHRTGQAATGMSRRRADTKTAAATASSGSAFDALLANLAAIRDEADENDAAVGGEDAQRWPSLTSRWRSLEATLDASVTRLNSALNPHGLMIAAAGEPNWSFRNRGYGTYRRVLVAGQSIAWLRAEITQTNSLALKVRAHQIQHALVNAATESPAEAATPNAVLEGLAQVVGPAAEFAAWTMPRRETGDAAGEAAWSNVDALAREAVALAAEAFKPSGVALEAVAEPAWDEVTGRQRWRLVLRHAGADIATADLSLATTAIDVAVVARDRLRNALDRRRRLDLAGLTPKLLADAMTASAWPVIADAQNRTDTSKLGYAG